MTDPAIDALQKALATEHSVIWGYSLVGGKVRGSVLADVRNADSTHRSRRDTLIHTIRSANVEPVAPQASYQLPFPVTDHASALRLALHLEEGAASSWRFVIGNTTDVGQRTTAVAALTDAAVRATRWRMLIGGMASTVVFPGT